MCHGHDPKKMACKGAPTISHPNGCEECQACGDSVARDLVNEPFWRFSDSCDHATHPETTAD